MTARGELWKGLKKAEQEGDQETKNTIWNKLSALGVSVYMIWRFLQGVRSRAQRNQG